MHSVACARLVAKPTLKGLFCTCFSKEIFLYTTKLIFLLKLLLHAKRIKKSSPSIHRCWLQGQKKNKQDREVPVTVIRIQKFRVFLKLKFRVEEDSRKRAHAWQQQRQGSKRAEWLPAVDRPSVPTRAYGRGHQRR